MTEALCEAADGKSCQVRFYVGSVAWLANTPGSQIGTFTGEVE